MGRVFKFHNDVDTDQIIASQFYRNSINIGLPVIISKDLYDKVEDGADIDINLSEGWIKTEDETLPCTKLPPYMQNILDHGGLINFLNEGEE